MESGDEIRLQVGYLANEKRAHVGNGRLLEEDNHVGNGRFYNNLRIQPCRQWSFLDNFHRHHIIRSLCAIPHLIGSENSAQEAGNGPSVVSF